MTVLFKLGGSLLTLQGLADRLAAVLRFRSGQNCLIAPGGGSTADVVREWSRIHDLDQEVAHRLAIASLDFNLRLLQSIGGWTAVESRQQAHEYWLKESAPVLLRMEKFLSVEEAAAAAERPQLPHHWDATSDSVAAWSALHWPAGELVLLKSVPLPKGLTAEQAADQQLVDRCFPGFAQQIPKVSWCNLRSLPVTIETWLVAESA